jgi:hypothetical protein
VADQEVVDVAGRDLPIRADARRAARATPAGRGDTVDDRGERPMRLQLLRLRGEERRARRARSVDDRLSETLKPGTGQEAPLQDTAADAPPSGTTLSFTVDAAACAARGGGNTGGGFPMVSIVAQDATDDLTRQHIVVQFE